jgi:hypothetical protein
MTLRTHLLLIEPDAASPPATPGSDAQALLLIERLCGGDPRAWSRVLSALYHAEDPPSAALARALADRLWLRPRVLLPPGLPASHWAGVLDQLGRQHAGGSVLVVAPRSAIAPAATRLLRLERALEAPDAIHGVRRLALDADTLALPDSSRGYMCTSFHARAAR